MVERIFVGSEANLAIRIDLRYEKYHASDEWLLQSYPADQFLY